YVLELVRNADEPVSVVDIAHTTGLHRNTARFHLDGLVDAGLVRRGTEASGRPGRPRTVYRVDAPETQQGRRSYRLLAEMLTGMITGGGSSADDSAVEAGEAWGRYLVERPAPSEPVDVV